MFEVQNQPPPLEPYNLFASDAVLREAVRREGASWAEGELTALGARLGKPETVQLGFDANKFPPQLRTLRPLRPPARRSRVSSGLARTARDRSRGRSSFESLGGSETGRARGARCRDLHARADRKRRVLPARDDLWLGADLAACAANRRRMAAANFLARVRPPVSRRRD